MPEIGLFVIIIWGTSDLFCRYHHYRALRIGLCAVALLALSIQTRLQFPYWADSVTLFQHTLKITGDNEVAYYSLGVEIYPI